MMNDTGRLLFLLKVYMLVNIRMVIAAANTEMRYLPWFIRQSLFDCSDEVHEARVDQCDVVRIG